MVYRQVDHALNLPHLLTRTSMKTKTTRLEFPEPVSIQIKHVLISPPRRLMHEM